MQTLIEVVAGEEALLTVAQEVGPQGAKGDIGDTGPGVPNGGAKDQVLVKSSGDDQDTAWKNVEDVTPRCLYILTGWSPE